MLVFTNREIGPGSAASAFKRSFQPGGTRLAMADVTASGSGWKLQGIDDNVSQKDALDQLQPLFQGAAPLLLYVHGNNNTPADCFRRSADLQKLYPGCVVLAFSWASEGFLADGSPLPGLSANEGGGDEEEFSGVTPQNRTKGPIQNKIRRYRQAQTNARDSVDAFARMLRLLGTARLQANAQPFSLAIHSLGGQLFQYSLQVPGATESASTAHNVVLLAPCVRSSGHAEWLTRFRPKGRTYVTYNRGDSVLFAAYVADGEQTKLGTDPGPDLLHREGVRYISFSDAPNDFGGHAYFVKSPTKAAKKLFSRLFASQVDFGLDESPKTVYPQRCEPDGSVCYMAVPKQGDVA